MRTYRYPELMRHAREHLEFNDQVKRLVERSVRMDVSAEMLAFIRNWRQEHVMTSDRLFAAYLSTVGVVTVPPTPRETTAPVHRLALVPIGSQMAQPAGN